MAFNKYANAQVVKPAITFKGWDEIRQKAGSFPNREASKVVLQSYDPKDFLLTHCTIMASVDTEDGPGALGRQMVDNFQIDRKYQNYYVTPATSTFINNNHDGWERRLLLGSYRTFIGSENFCFVGDTPILMADGTHKRIDHIEVGDEVVTHKGRKRRVTHTFKREVTETLSVLYFDRYQTPVKATGNHPFRKLEIRVPGTKVRAQTKPANVARYRIDALRGALRDGKGPFASRVITSDVWARADSLSKGDYVFGPDPVEQVGGDPDLGLLLGYYLAEGCLYRTYGRTRGVILSFGSHETALVQHAIDLASKVFPGVRISSRVTTSNTCRVEIVGPGVGEWFLRHGGEYSEDKRISEEVMTWAPENLLRVFAGWVSGDAQLHGKTKRIVGITCSRHLAAQMHRISEMCEVKASLWKESPESFGKRKQSTSTVTLTVGGEPKDFIIQSVHPQFNVIVSKCSVARIAELTPRWQGFSPVAKKREDFWSYGGKRVHKVSFAGREEYRGLVYNFEVEEDHSYVLGNGVAVHNCEHIQIPELSKGKIVDAAARDIGDSVYIDILVATNRKHRPLIAAISNGTLSTLSMGCQVAYTQCTKCGNVAQDETQLCPHIKYLKGNDFFDGTGTKRKIAELCGHYTDPDSVRFIEASWVANPAFRGAVLRNILSPEEIASVGGKLATALAEPVRVSDPTLIQKAAHLRVRTAQFGMDDVAPDMSKPKKKDEGGDDPIKKVVDDLADTVREHVTKRIREDIGKSESQAVKNLNENQNDTLIKSALEFPEWREIAKKVLVASGDRQVAKKILAGLIHYKSGGWTEIVKVGGFSGRELLSVSRMLDILTRRSVKAGESRLYRTVIAVGGMGPYQDIESYLAACRQVVGRDLSSDEVSSLIDRGRLFTLGS